MSDASSVSLTLNFTLGSGVTQSEYDYANNANQQAAKNAVAYLKKHLKNKNIKVSGVANTTRSDTNRNNTTTVEIK
jgi:hypothetical protein